VKSTWTKIDDLRFNFTDISREADEADEADEAGNDLLVESVETTELHLYGLDDLRRELTNRLLSWKDFCLDFESGVEQLEWPKTPRQPSRMLTI